MKLEIAAKWVEPTQRMRDQALPFDIRDYQRDAGVVYLLEFEGKVKVGSTISPDTRIRTHCGTLRGYGIKVDTAYISRPMIGHGLAEIQIHRQMHEFLVPNAREVFQCDPMDIIREAEIVPFKFYGRKKVVTPEYAMLREKVTKKAVA